jgi:hypothetical protein
VKHIKPIARSCSALFGLLALLALPVACKDEEPCDDNQDSIGTGCYAKSTAEAGSPPAGAEGGAPPSLGGGASEGGSAEPAGNPDAMFQSPCESDAECGGPAPICLIPPGPKYCSQIDCLDDEVNAGSCPEDWVCFKLNAETRSACLNPN